MPQISSRRIRQLLLADGPAVDPDSLGEEVRLYGPDGQPIDLTPTDIPLGGTTGQVLAKNSDTDQDIEWITPPVSLPAGGSTNQYLGKNSGADLDVGWKNIPFELPVGGAIDQVLAKNSATDRDVKWATPAAGGGSVMSPGTVMDTWHLVGAAGEPAFGTNWANYDTTTYNAVGFQKTPTGRVQLKGQVRGSSTWPPPAALFTLPAGYRPPKQLMMMARSNAGALALLSIAPTGAITVLGGSSDWLTLEGLEFDTETVTTSPGVVVNPAQITMDTVHLIGAAGEPAFVNSWVNFDSARAARYRKDPTGRVGLAGLIKNGVVGQPAFTLPAGYRPIVEQTFVSNSNGAFGIVVVETTGIVRPNAGNNAYFSLAGIEFDTEATSQMTGLVGSAGVNMDTWHVVGNAGEPAFVNSWVNFGGAYANAAFRKLPNGQVEIRGGVKSGTLPGTIFTLPPGYRPPSNVTFTLATGGGVNIIGSLLIAPDGTVQSVAGNNAYLPLDGVLFDTDTVLQTATVGAQPMDTWHAVGAAGEPAFGAGVANSGTQPVQFRKNPFGKVQIRGAVTKPGSTTALFTLPVGYRPPNNYVRFATIDLNTAASVQLYVDSNGVVTSYGSSTGIDLSTVEFDTDTVASYSAGIIGPPRVTALPANPVDGQECYFVADATNGVIWHLRYNAASASPYKWEVVGGSELSTFVQTASGETTGSTTYADITTPGPSIALPLAGDYDVTIAFTFYHSASGSGFMSFAVGGTAALDTDAAAGTVLTSPGIQILRVMRKVRKTAMGAVTLTAKYRTLAGTLTVAGTSNLGGTPREMRAMPVRVG